MIKLIIIIILQIKIDFEHRICISSISSFQKRFTLILILNRISFHWSSFDCANDCANRNYSIFNTCELSCVERSKLIPEDRKFARDTQSFSVTRSSLKVNKITQALPDNFFLFIPFLPPNSCNSVFNQNTF